MREAKLSEKLICIFSLNIFIHINLRQTDTGHTNLLTLIYKRRSALTYIHRCKHLSALNSELLVAVSAYDSRLVMIFYIVSIPCDTIELRLPVVICLLKLSEAKGSVYPAYHKAVRFHMLEVEHHIEFLFRSLLNESQSEFRSHHGRLSDGHAVIIIRDLSKLTEIFIKIRTALIMLHATCGGNREAVGQALFLGYKGYDIFTEAVNSHIQPETNYILDFLTNLWIIHIQIRLFFAEKMQIPLIKILVILPTGSGEGRKPIVGRLLSVWLFSLAPKIIVVIRIILALFALYKPLVLI